MKKENTSKIENKLDFIFKDGETVVCYGQERFFLSDIRSIKRTVGNTLAFNQQFILDFADEADLERVLHEFDRFHRLGTNIVTQRRDEAEAQAKFWFEKCEELAAKYGVKIETV